MRLRPGITTGTCAAAAAKAAAMVLGGGPAPGQVELRLPGGQCRYACRCSSAQRIGGEAAVAAVRKDAGDDPDVTHGMEVRATVAWDTGEEVTLVAGEGVGTVTKPGLQVPPGEPAINPVPRQMIAAALREVTARGLRVEIAIPGGARWPERPSTRGWGSRGGLSILGTTGIVRPCCTQALHDALRCGSGVAAACGVKAPVLVPGNIGAKAARRHFALRDEQVIEVGNAWGFVLDEAACGLAGSLPALYPHPSPLPRGAGTCAFHALLLSAIPASWPSSRPDSGTRIPPARPRPRGILPPSGPRSWPSGGRDAHGGRHAGGAGSRPTGLLATAWPGGCGRRSPGESRIAPLWPSCWWTWPGSGWARTETFRHGAREEIQTRPARVPSP